jgi:hypothetical protein
MKLIPGKIYETTQLYLLWQKTECPGTKRIPLPAGTRFLVLKEIKSLEICQKTITTYKVVLCDKPEIGEMDIWDSNTEKEILNV